jgi:predicted ATP-dependent protease
MMTWDYRVFREDDGDYIIREVFYAEDGAIIGCTADAVEPFGSTLEELAQSIEDFKAALTLPVLTLKDIPESAPEHEKRKNNKTISHEQLRAQFGLDNTSGHSNAAARSRSKKASAGS